MNINYHNFAICSNTNVGSVDTNAGSDKAVHAVNHFHAPVIPTQMVEQSSVGKLASMCVTRKNYINTVRIVIRQMISSWLITKSGIDGSRFFVSSSREARFLFHFRCVFHQDVQ